jgi:hypothetical protein
MSRGHDDVNSDSTDPIDPLVADLTLATLAQSQQTTDLLIESLTKRAETAEATIEVIRSKMGNLLDREYAPSERMIVRALYPKDKEIEEFRQHLFDGDH